MIKVHPWVYKGLWVVCLLLGLLLALPFPLLILTGASVAITSDVAAYALIAGELLGIVLIVFSTRRLMKPLRADT